MKVFEFYSEVTEYYWF